MKFNGLIPELSVSNINESKIFYIDILGFHLEYERLEDKFAFLSYGETQIMIEEINGHWDTGELQYPFGRGINFQIETDDVYKQMMYINIHEPSVHREDENFAGTFSCHE